MKPSGIGGQAVIEGIMMKNKDKYSIAVRKPDQEIEITVRECNQLSNKYKWLKYPVIRGIYSFADSLVTGISTISYSASFYDDPAEQKSTKVDEIGKSIFQDKLEAVLMAATVIVSIVFAVGLFMLVPYFVSRLLAGFVASEFLLNFIEGVLRVVLFLLYILAISCMKDIKRTFMYHGAEHKCINCIENGARLTPENVKNSSRLHKRCGTSFLFIVMFISIIFFIFIRVENTALQMLIRILLIPVIAGVSYEVIRFAGKSENPVINAVSKPGLMLQKFTTKEPDMDMIEVAIKAVEEVFDWRAFLNEYYKDSVNPEADLKTNEAALALTSNVNTSADRETRSINPVEAVTENAQAVNVHIDEPDIQIEPVNNEEDYSDIVSKTEYISQSSFMESFEASDESESTMLDNVSSSEDLDEDSDELPEGFVIIEDDDSYEHGISENDISDYYHTADNSVNMQTDKFNETDSTDISEALSEEEFEDDGFEFIEDNDEDDIDTGDDLPIFRQRADKKR